jgi:hypothetical protein
MTTYSTCRGLGNLYRLVAGVAASAACASWGSSCLMLHLEGYSRNPPRSAAYTCAIETARTRWLRIHSESQGSTKRQE